MVEQTQEIQKKKRGRSPSYPGIALEKAIGRAEVLRKAERSNFAPIDAILNHWGFKPRSGLGLVNLAALVKFGLLEDAGSGNNRQARLTELASAILLSQHDSPEHLDAVRKAALNPPIHAELWEQYGQEMPSSMSMKLQLIRQGFMDNAASDLVQEYIETIHFAKLLESDIISGSKPDKPSPIEDEVTLKVGEQSQLNENELLPPPPVNDAQVERYRWRLSRNVVADLSLTGKSISAGDLEMLRKYLQLAKDALDEESNE